MAYVKNTWVDQDVERPKTYEMTNNADGSVTLIDSFGLVSEMGTPVNADNMNHIEEGIAGCAIRKYTSTETYEKGEWVTGIADDEKGIYESLTDNNYGNPLTDETKWQKVELGGGSGTSLPLFTPVIQDHILSFEESKGYALQGTYVYKTGVAGARYGYPDFVEKCIAEKTAGTASQVTLGENTITMYTNSNGHIFYDIADKAAVDTWFNTWGVADFYGVDTENERIFLPRNNKFMQFTTDTSKVNGFNEAGSPNITGEVTLSSTAVNNSSGCITYENGWNANHGTGSDAWPKCAVYIDASKSSPVYGNSDTVQVASSNKLLYYVVGNTEVSSAETNVVDITSSENDTLPEFYNFYSEEGMTTTGAYVNASLGSFLNGNLYTSIYNKLVNRIGQSFCAGYVRENTDEYTNYDVVINQTDMTFRLPLLNGSEDLPSTKYDNLTLKTSGSFYIAPANGWYTLKKVATASNQYITINSNLRITKNIPRDNNTEIAASLFVAKGESVQIDYNAAGTTNLFIFEYAKGNGSLYFKVGNALQNQDLIDMAAVNSEITEINSEITALKTNITAYNMPDYMAGIAISGYTSTSNMYTAPVDGYVIGVDSNQNQAYVNVTLYSPEGTKIKNVVNRTLDSGSGMGASVSLSLPKGFKLVNNYNPASGSVFFYPMKGAN